MTEPTTADIQERHDEGILDAIDYPIPHKGVTAHNDRGILLKRLEAADELNDDQAHRLGKAEQKLCDIRAYAHNSERVTWRMQRIKAILKDK